MGYASRSGRAVTSSRNPRAHAICDRCGFRYNHDRLRFQYDWAGASMINKRILVCEKCYDVPQEQLRAIILPADPMPIINPRVENFVAAETNYRATSGQILEPSAATGDGSTATLTLRVPASFAPIPLNSTIIVSGMEPSSYNGTHVVTGSTSASVSFASRETSPMTTAGRVAINIDPVTGLQIQSTSNLVTESGDNRVTQQTGEPPFGTNQRPGTSIMVPDDAGGNDPGLPYNNTTIPETGSL